MEKRSISEIRQEFAGAWERCQRDEAGTDGMEELFERYKEDSRSGVAGLIARYRREEEKLQRERERLYAMRAYEREYAAYGRICGIDEAGRGPLAGPVVAAAVILPENGTIWYLNDSKQLSQKRREELYDEIFEKALGVGVGMSSPERIDEINILQATYEAMRQAVGQLNPPPALLLNDAVRIPGISIPQVPIVKGDAKSLSIAAASVIAKVTRDRLMLEYDRQMPQYGFASHKGYGSASHIQAVRTYGPSPIHRRSFLTHFLDPEEGV